VTAWGGAYERASGIVAARVVAIGENIRNGLAILVRRPPPMPTGFVPAWRRLKVQGVATLGATMLTMIFLDARAHEFASGLPPWLVDVFYEITDFGRSGWILAPVGGLIALIALLASPALDRMSRAVLAVAVARLGYVFIAVGLPGLVGTIVKRWIGRLRPSAQGPFAYEPFSWRPDYASFPSGHATTAFAALVAFGAIFPRARPLLWTYALLIAVSRVVVTAHYPSDVIAGAALGGFGALWVRDWFAVRRLAFFVGADSAAHVKPGPSLRRIKQVAGTLIVS
jgi:membrane-associated phospholipid phosphatase